MKMNREELKSLIKECIVEVLTEGLGSAPAQRQSVQMEGRRGGTAKVPVQQRSSKQRFDPRLDTPVALKDIIKKEAGGNPLMESIFSDTARTTLQEQLSAERSPGGGGGAGSRISQQEQFHGDPEEVFGEEAASKWASLAFG